MKILLEIIEYIRYFDCSREQLCIVVLAKSIDNEKKPILETSGDIIGFGPHWDHNCYIEYITSKLDTRKRVDPHHLSLPFSLRLVFNF